MNCSNCNRSLIEEESKYHVCKKATRFYIKGDILWLSDGTTEYPLKLSKVLDDLRTGKIKIYQPKFYREKINRRFDRTIQ